MPWDWWQEWVMLAQHMLWTVLALQTETVLLLPLIYQRFIRFLQYATGDITVNVFNKLLFFFFFFFLLFFFFFFFFFCFFFFFFFIIIIIIQRLIFQSYYFYRLSPWRLPRVEVTPILHLRPVESHLMQVQVVGFSNGSAVKLGNPVTPRDSIANMSLVLWAFTIFLPWNCPRWVNDQYIYIYIYIVEDDFEVDFQEASCLSLHILWFLRIYIYIHTWKQVSLNPFGRWALAPSKTCWGCIVNLHMQGRPNKQSIKNWMGPYQRTPQEFDRAIRYSGWGVRSVGPVGDFLEAKQQLTTISSERKERMNGNN